MDFVKYAEGSADLLNTELANLGQVRDYVASRPWLVVECTERDVTLLRRFQTNLREVYLASEERRTDDVVAKLNTLMEEHPITPRISSHESDNLHLHVAPRAGSVSSLLISEALLGLANLVCDHGPTRLGVCSATNCNRVYVDTSPNSSRRYCSERCSSRANVAAYRARQRAALS